MSRPSKHQLFVWGKNRYGQLGLGCESKVITELRILNVPDTTWTQVACGLFHTAAVSSNGEVFTWGCSGNGQLGHGDCMDRNVPKKVEIPGGEVVVKVACGVYYTAAVTRAGKLFTWYVSNFNHFLNQPLEESWVPNTLWKGRWALWKTWTGRRLGLWYTSEGKRIG